MLQQDTIDRFWKGELILQQHTIDMFCDQN